MGTLNLLLLVGFIYFVLTRRYPVELKWFILVLVGYVLAIVGPTGLSRFRLSVMPFLILALPPLLESLLALNSKRIR